MKIEDGYLSDEELEQLMLEVEEQELVSAPPGFMDCVLAELEQIETCRQTAQSIEDVRIKASGYTFRQKDENRDERRITEFQKYCIRVITSAAAAIAILFALPGIEPAQLLPQVPARQEVLSRQEVLIQEEVLSRQEVVGRTLPKEEVLSDTGFLTKVIDSLNYRIGGFSNETEKEK